MRKDGYEVGGQKLKKGHCKARPCAPMLSEDYFISRKAEIKPRLPGRLSRWSGFCNERVTEALDTVIGSLCLTMMY